MILEKIQGADERVLERLVVAFRMLVAVDRIELRQLEMQLKQELDVVAASADTRRR